jgi:uncharacterized protein (DUF885 family)
VVPGTPRGVAIENLVEEVAVGAVRELADRHLIAYCALDPYKATSLGIVGHDHELSDLSPDGAAARADLARSTLRSLAAIESSEATLDRDDQLCAALLRDRLSLQVEMADAREPLRGLRIVGSELEDVLSAFEAMTPADDEQWATFVARVEAVPTCLSSYESSLREGIRSRLLSAPRQATGVAEQLRAWAHAGGTGYFGTRLASAPASLRRRADSALAAARGSLDGFERFLLTTYRQAAADTPDAVGRDRYGLHVRQHLGAFVDVDDASVWAWGELERIEADMRSEAHAVRPGMSVDEAFAWLDEHGDAAHGELQLIEFLQNLMDDTIASLNGVHFELPEPVRTVQAMIAPAGSSAAQYYTAPSLDFSRPGRTWNPTLGRSKFPLWNEVSTCYHEAVPGHHLQLAQWVYRAKDLSKFQGTEFVSGNGEGWALYAERLMDELGFFTIPGSRLGYLVAQQLRATRVIVDIGMHCETIIPKGQPFHPGERWTAELGREFLFKHAGKDAEFLQSEWLRYLGWPGQAICYKLGERVWLDGRAAAKRAQGVAFDLKRWHSNALDLGSLGLDALARELVTC